MAKTVRPETVSNPSEPAGPPPAGDEAAGHDSAAPATLTWFTVETLLYALIFGLGLALRLVSLDHYPLADIEARQALQAVTLYQGGAIETGTPYSPLLVTLNTLTFLLLDDSDTTARLAVVVLGSGLILLPALLRRHLGRRESLLAAALLAFSPTTLFLSRTLNSHIGVALGALLLVAGFFNWADQGRQRWLYLMAGGLVIMVTAGTMAYATLLVFAVIVAVRWTAFKALWLQGLRRAETEQTSEAAAKNKSTPTQDTDSTPPAMPGSVRRAGLLLLALLILLATTATFNLSGLGETANLFTGWLSRFGFQPQPDAGFNAVFLLTVYEPLLVVAGIVGLAQTILGRSLLRQLFAGWFLGLLLLDLLTFGRPNGAVIVVLVPLAFLAAFALAGLWRGLAAAGSWSNEGVILAAGLVIGIFGYIGLTGWLVRPCAPDDSFCQMAWLQPVAALSLFVVIVLFFAFINGVEVALRGAALTGTVFGLIMMVGFGWRLSFGSLTGLAYQPLAAAPASVELVTLANTLTSESLTRTGDRRMLDITVVEPVSPALRWQLRHYKNVTGAQSVIGAPGATAIITPLAVNSDVGLGEAYIGQDFAVEANWSPVGMTLKDFVNWLIYRQTTTPPQSNQVILWLRLS